MGNIVSYFWGETEILQEKPDDDNLQWIIKLGRLPELDAPRHYMIYTYHFPDKKILKKDYFTKKELRPFREKYSPIKRTKLHQLATPGFWCNPYSDYNFCKAKNGFLFHELCAVEVYKNLKDNTTVYTNNQPLGIWYNENKSNEFEVGRGKLDWNKDS